MENPPGRLSPSLYTDSNQNLRGGNIAKSAGPMTYCSFEWHWWPFHESPHQARYKAEWSNSFHLWPLSVVASAPWPNSGHFFPLRSKQGNSNKANKDNFCRSPLASLIRMSVPRAMYYWTNMSMYVHRHLRMDQFKHNSAQGATNPSLKVKCGGKNAFDEKDFPIWKSFGISFGSVAKVNIFLSATCFSKRILRFWPHPLAWAMTWACVRERVVY